MSKKNAGFIFKLNLIVFFFFCKIIFQRNILIFLLPIKSSERFFLSFPLGLNCDKDKSLSPKDKTKDSSYGWKLILADNYMFKVNNKALDQGVKYVQS